MRKTYTAELGNLEAIAADTSDFLLACGATERQVYAANLAVDEVFTNIVTHACGKNSRRKVEFEFGKTVLRGKSAVTIEVSDDAGAFNPLEEAGEPDVESGVEDRKIGGLGVFFVKKSMDKVSYKRENGRNILSMTKILD